MKRLIPLFLAAATSAAAQDASYAIGVTTRQDTPDLLRAMHGDVAIEAIGRSATAQPEDDRIMLSLEPFNTMTFHCDHTADTTSWLTNYIGLSTADLARTGKDAQTTLHEASAAMYEHRDENIFSPLSKQEISSDFATKFEKATGVTITVFSVFVPAKEKGCYAQFP